MRFFCSRSRDAKRITAGICLILRGLFFEHNLSACNAQAGAEIGQVSESTRLRKDHLWMDTRCRGVITKGMYLCDGQILTVICVRRQR